MLTKLLGKVLVGVLASTTRVYPAGADKAAFSESGGMMPAGRRQVGVRVPSPKSGRAGPTRPIERKTGAPDPKVQWDPSKHSMDPGLS